MSVIFRSLDDALIDKVFQPCVDWISEHLQLDCFQQARACTTLSAIVWILSQAGDLIAAVRSGVAGVEAVQVTLLLLGLAAIMVLHTLFQRGGGVGAGQGRMNPLRAGMYVHRLMLLLGFAVTSGKAMIGLGSLAMLTVSVVITAAVYIGACSNPPAKQRERLGAGWEGRLAPVKSFRVYRSAEAPRPYIQRC